MDDKIKINLNIAGRYYPRTIDRKDEQWMRDAAKQVNETLTKYQELYQDISLQDALAMTAYHLSERVIKMEGRHDTEPYKAKIEELTEVLENYFKRPE